MNSKIPNFFDETDLQARAIADAYTTLRAVQFTMKRMVPLMSAQCEEALELLREAFPSLMRLERIIRVGEQELLQEAINGSEGEAGGKEQSRTQKDN